MQSFLLCFDWLKKLLTHKHLQINILLNLNFGNPIMFQTSTENMKATDLLFYFILFYY